MTRYEMLTLKIEDNRKRALAAADGNLKTFYLNAMRGFEIMRGKLTVEQAGEIVE